MSLVFFTSSCVSVNTTLLFFPGLVFGYLYRGLGTVLSPSVKSGTEDVAVNKEFSEEESPMKQIAMSETFEKI